nr:arginine-ornithine antiporter [Phycicoccus endophyticus]
MAPVVPSKCRAGDPGRLARGGNDVSARHRAPRHRGPLDPVRSPRPDRATPALGLAALTALVVGSMIGSGIFALPSQMAASAAPGPLLIGWVVTGVGMLMLAFVFQTLAQRKPEVDGGVYGYARAGFGSYIGFSSAWGYWVSAWVGNVAYLVLLFATLGYFVPAFEGGSTLPAVVGASVLLWVVHALVLRGVHSAAVVNTIVTIAKVVPILTFVAIAAVGFRAGLFTADVWGRTTQVDGAGLGSTLEQVRTMMLVTVWVFIGIEGAAVYSQRARSRWDVGRATVLGFAAVLALLLLVNLLSYGLMAQADIAGLEDPSMAALLEHEVGSWGAAFISVGLVVSLLGALLAWVLLCVEILRLPALEHVMPAALARENAHGAPATALWLTNGCVQLLLLWTLVNDSTYTNLVYLATSLILLPYLWSAGYQVLLAARGETYETGHGRTRDLVVGSLALVYACWLVYAGGLDYLLVAALFYLVGTGFFVWARRESHLPVFTPPERVVVGVVGVVSVVAVAMLATGHLAVL